MRALIQRVSSASVTVDDQLVGSIERGLCVFIGVSKEDKLVDAERLTGKITKLRIFPDEDGKMNRSLIDTAASLLVISQFTLYADTSRGNRPSYVQAAEPQAARKLYEAFIELLRLRGIKVESGVFQAHMRVSLINDGPVTIMCDSAN
jgi:D-aminoacyl-tRNA deacylase